MTDKDGAPKRPRIGSSASDASLAVVPAMPQTVASYGLVAPLPKPKKHIVDEDRFVSALEKIITRDFYPELPKLQAQGQYLDALETGDAEKLRDIHIRYHTPLVGAATPAAFETPGPFRPPSTQPSVVPVQLNSVATDDDALDTNMSLNDFLAKYTSEDNDSFEEIINTAQERLRKRYRFLYEPSRTQETALALTSEAKLAIKAGGVSVPLDTWHHTPMNALMFLPSTAELTLAERMALITKGTVKVNHSATRFEKQPFPGSSTGRESVTTGSTTSDQSMDGRIGFHNMFATGSDSPKVNGFGFVVTPSPAPGIDDTPIMTWGVIDGSPFRLDAGDVAASPGPVFKIPESNRREKLGLRLAEQVHEKHRKARAESTTGTPVSRPASRGSGVGTPSQFARMSPAAQKLSQQVLKNTPGMSPGIFGSTPHSQMSGSRTPLLTPRSKGTATPRVGSRTPVVAQQAAQQLEGKAVGGLPTSVTDDLLS